MSDLNNEGFDITKVRLSGNNTFEASAGTGKTYSLAILVVRLLLEKRIPIERILLVTFTEAAAAELKERTNRFIRLALKEVDEKGSSKDETISKIVSNSDLAYADQKALLQTALINIDKATIATIHSFCQQTLIEFAFETGQVFGKELIPNIDDLIDCELNEYVRSEMYQSNYSFFKELGISSKAYFKDSLVKKMGGLNFYMSLKAESVEDLENLLSQKIKEVTDKFEKHLDDYRKAVRETSIKRFPKKRTLASLNSGDEFYNYLRKSGSSLLPQLFQNEIDLVKENSIEVNNIKKYVSHYQLKKAAGEITPKLLTKLNRKNALTFNSLIDLLYQKRNSEDLIELMREKYEAVFVDEFQDTDPKQYGIFKSFFQDHEDTILFFIGDPKQSIYGWRQADVETYKKARDSDNMRRLEMNINYRSSAPFINAANNFFQLDENSTLDYIQVESKDNNNNVGLKYDQVLDPALQLVENDSNHEPSEFIKTIFIRLFSEEMKLAQNEHGGLNDSSVSPENISILVRTGKQAKESKRILNKLGVPSIVIAEQNVFTTRQAKDLKVIFDAVMNINQGSVYYALITELIGVPIDKLNAIDQDEVFAVFYNCKAIWEKDGVSKMMNTLMQSFGVISKHEGNIIKGHQTLANTKQIIDILQKKTIQEALTPSEVLAFLSNQIKSPDSNNESYQQTVENDEKAVKIMTIHKSKGLEFDIVVLPYLNLSVKEKGLFTSFRKSVNGTGQYYFTLKGTEGEPLTLFKQQEQEENERLLYVAITRAKYNVFLFEGKSKGNLLPPYFNGIKNIESKTISSRALSEFSKEVSAGQIDFHKSSIDKPPKPGIGDISIADKDYYKMSYSFLASKHKYHPKEESENYEVGSYDHFIYKELPKGAHIGNVLHDMFEFSDFTLEVEDWRVQVEQALGRYYPSALQDADMKDRYVSQLLQLMDVVVKTPFEIKGEQICLNQISDQQRVNELEFNFAVPNVFDPSELEGLVDTENDLRTISTTSSQVYGMMNGFVDLFFEHNGKYYILDWKSNYLGDQLEKYTPDNLTDAMSESNYHLQYLLYSFAVDKFLKNRLGDAYSFEKNFGGVIYVFLRGVRENEKTGFFVQDVRKEEIDRIGDILMNLSYQN